MAVPEIVQGWPTRRQIEWVLTQYSVRRLTLPQASDEIWAIVGTDRESFLERALQIYVCTIREEFS